MTLIHAGIQRATTLSCFLATDVSNAFVALSARMLAPDLRIIACVRRPGACRQLRSAGADLVIDPYKRELFGVRRVNSVGM
jgi:voltage-gated potassium channel Kch